MLLNAKIIVADLSVLAKMLALLHTLWVGVKFYVASRDMAKAVQELILTHVLNGKVTISRDDIK